MVGKDLIMATLFGSGGGSSGSGGGDEKSLLDALIDGSVTEINNDTVTTIGMYAFAYRRSLVSAKFLNATSVGSSAFYECNNLLTLELPNVETITSPFKYCKSLEKMKMPKLKSVNSSSFQYCSKLESADFAVATSVGTYSFSMCSKFKALILRSETMASLQGTNAFQSTLVESGAGYIYVPRALVGTYKAATNWSTFADQFRALEDYTVDGTITGELDESKI